MDRTDQKAGVLRFGTFELELASGELRKGGVLIKLQALPFQLLALLAGRAGEVISREEIRRALWDDDTFVDFDRSINFCVNQIRESLGDDPQNPRFIETLPRKGYRFIAPVTEDGGEPSKAEVAPEPSVVSKPARSVRRWLMIAAAVIVLVAIAGLAKMGLGWNHGVKPIRSLAVLPLENLSHDPEQEYFADGMTDDLITNLARISALRVISRTTVMQYKGTRKSVPEIARELNVDAILEGTVARDQDRVRVTAQLIGADPEKHLWAEKYEAKLSDVLSVQDNVAEAVARAIQIKVTPQERVLLAAPRAANPEAYESYLKGRYWWNKQTEEGFRKGIEYFEQAIARDPSYALAYVGLADCYSSMANSGIVSAKEGFLKARESAEKALKLDDSLAAAHISLASIKTDYEWDWDRAEQEARRAIELNPSDAGARLALAEVLRTTGRMDESIQERKRAVELDPLSINCNIELAFDFFLSRHHDQAIEQGARTLELDPKYVPAYYVRGVAYVQKSMYKEAMAEFERGVSFAPDNPGALTGLGYGYAVMGKRAEAESVIARLKEMSKQEFVSPVWMAKIYSGLGEKDEAFESLERAYEDRSIVSVAYIKTNPMLDPLRTDPRFGELIRRLNLQP